ncbi:Werner Syndrome-like exonuclease [Abrus precatorius]|uniref:Werner Syndrome-like exonuclease n=1 Tax=Abrus precatorius TaxID=3816 RepID=A0A8B8KCJ0_ABRPR|nr:Werner Syndrome-like exonuclease [Abrus precatorius]
MGIRIEKLHTPKRSTNVYAVTINRRVITTTVTSSRTVLSSWIEDHLQAPNRRQRKVVGLDIEWRPSFTRGVTNPAAIIQLCIKNCCLIFQLYQASSIPRCLYMALENPNITYTGVKISGDAKKLEEDYGLEVAYFADVAAMAAEEFGQKEFRRAGLKTLVELLTGEDMEKPKHVALSNWEVKELTCAQVKYACVDAYYSYRLGKWMISGKW